MSFTLSLAHLTALDATPPQLVEVAHAGGFGAVGLRLHPARLGEAPFPMRVGSPMQRETQARLQTLGLRVHDVEVVRLKPGFDVGTLAGVFESAQSLGARLLMVNVDDDEPARAAQNLGRLAERAAVHGLQVGVEFMVYTAVRTLQDARRLVAASGSAAACVVIDALHFFRSGGDPAELDAALETDDRVTRRFLQLNDAPAQRHLGLSPAEEGRAHRLLPGEGALPLAGLLRRLDADAVLAVEAPSAIRNRTWSAAQRAAAAHAATAAYLNRSGHACH